MAFSILSITSLPRKKNLSSYEKKNKVLAKNLFKSHYFILSHPFVSSLLTFFKSTFGMYFSLPSLGDFGQMIEEQNKYSVLAYN